MFLSRRLRAPAGAAGGPGSPQAACCGAPGRRPGPHLRRARPRLRPAVRRRRRRRGRDRSRRYPHRLWTSIGTHARESGSTPYAARLWRDWRFFVQAGLEAFEPRPALHRARAGLLFSRFSRSRRADGLVRYPHRLWTSIGTQARTSGSTPYVARPRRDWLFFVQPWFKRANRCRRRIANARACFFRAFLAVAAPTASFAIHTACGQALGHTRGNRVPRLVRRGFGEIGDFLSRRGFERANRCRRRVASVRACFSALFSQSPHRRLVALSTQAVDKHWDTRAGIGFHALCGAASERLAIFCPGRIASARKRIATAPRCRAGRMSSNLRRRRIVAARRYPHRLWTSMRTAALESGFTPCATRLLRV